MITQKLSDLKINEKAIIDSFTNDELYIKLMELGCVPGETVEIEHIGIKGDPISIYVAGYNLSLRLDEAATIKVIKH